MLLESIAGTALAVLLLVAMAQASETPSKARQEEVARRGAQVMPFSLSRAIHGWLAFAKDQLRRRPEYGGRCDVTERSGERARA
jgi:hypothetical protein